MYSWPKSLRFLVFLSCIWVGSISTAVAQCNISTIPTVTHNCITQQSYVEFTISGTSPGPFNFTVTSPGHTDTGMTPINTGTAPYYGISNYNVTIQASNGCTTMNTALVTPAFSIALVVGSISFTNATCYGVSNGSAFITPPLSFNQGPFTYTWTPGNFNTQGVSTLSPGVTYTAVVANSVGCTANNTVVVGQPAEINSGVTSVFIPCFGGSIQTIPTSSGGVSPYTYSLNGAAGGTSFAVTAGVYSLTTKDAQQCVKVNTINITEAPQVLITFTPVSPSCPGRLDGSISAGAVNGFPPLSYSWQPPAVTTTVLSSIPAGNYTLTVTDASACVTRSVGTVIPASSITAAASTQSENCSAADGGFTLQVSGGTAPYTYTTFPMNVNSGTLSNISSGTYTTIIMDAHQCRDTIIVLVGNLSTVSLSISGTTSISCHDECTGAMVLNVLNGTAPYTFSATGIPSTTNNTIQSMCPGSYFIKVLDANGCPATNSLQLINPPLLSYSVAQPPVICVGKSSTVSAQAQGGTGAYTYLWVPGNLTSQQVVLSPGISTVYSVNVYDANGCTQPPFAVSVSVNAPLSITVNPNSSGICPGTTAQITPSVSGGDGVYGYLWLPGNTTGATLYLENITISTYTFIVNDQCGSPVATQVIDLQLFEVEPPTYTTDLTKGCAPFCVTFINTSPNTLKAYWNYGDDANDEIGDTTVNCYQNSGYYNVLLTVLDQHSCTAAAWFNKAIEVFPKPVVDFTTEPKTVTRKEAGDVLLKNTSNDAVSFSWYLDGNFVGSSSEVHVSFPDTLCYDVRLVAKSSNQCVDSTTKTICVYEDFNFYMPNAITANKDGLNDVLLPQGTGWGQGDYKFEIFNQWGHRIFFTDKFSEGWDADWRINNANAKYPKAAKEDAYLWFVEIHDRIGQKHKLNGTVIVLR